MQHDGFEDILLEEDETGVLTVTLNRPEKLNALTIPMRQGLKRLATFVDNRDSIKVVVLTGAGRGFCSGADMSTGAPNPYDQVASRREMSESRYSWIVAFRDISKPVIAAVNGPAAGGGLSLALACDIRFASVDASFSAVWVRRGLVPDMGASHLLVQAIGIQNALRMMWSGEMVHASRALDLGLVQEVVPASELQKHVNDYARSLARGPLVTLALCKRLAYYGASHSLAESADLEDLYQRMVAGTADVQEGRRSFQEGRPPQFTGH